MIQMYCVNESYIFYQRDSRNNFIAKTEISKYKEKLKSEVFEGKRGSTYPILKKLAQRPGEGSSSSFHLPSHIERKFSVQQSAEAIAEHFSSISQEYEPLIISSLPSYIRDFLSQPNDANLPYLTPPFCCLSSPKS